MAEPSRSFTIRVPMETYFELGNLANQEGVHLNTKINQIILLGLGKHISLDEALKRLIMKTVTDDE